MTPAADPVPRGVLVIDDESMALAVTPGEARPVSPQALLAGEILPEAVLMRTMRRPRRQRTGPQALAQTALRDYPFYAFIEGFDDDALEALDTFRTPYDRILRRGPADRASPADIAVDDDGVETLLAAVFPHLAPDGESAMARLRAKWRFGDMKRELAARLARLVRANAGSNRPLRLAHVRCGDGSWSLALGDGVAYTGIEDRADSRAAAQARFPGLNVQTPETLAAAGAEKFDVFLLVDTAGDDIEADDIDARADVLAAAARLGAREATVIAILPRQAGSTWGGVIDDPAVSGLTAALGRAFGAPCELRRLATLSHKPYDALPATILVEYEVGR